MYIITRYKKVRSGSDNGLRQIDVIVEIEGVSRDSPLIIYEYVDRPVTVF